MTPKQATVPRAAWTPPAPRRVRALRDRLRLLYGRPVAPPHGRGLEELILTVLSQSTNDRNRDVAYLRLRARLPAWEAVRDAPLDEVEAAIQPGGLHRQKSLRIQEILRALPDPPDLAFLAELPVAEARDVPDRAAGRRAQDRGLRAAVRVRDARRARSTRTSRASARGSGCSAPAPRSRSSTTSCSRSRRAAGSSSCTSTCSATAAAPATRSAPRAGRARCSMCPYAGAEPSRKPGCRRRSSRATTSSLAPRRIRRARQPTPASRPSRTRLR